MSDKCIVRDGKFVEPCDILGKNTSSDHAAFSRKKGITRWQWVDRATFKTTRVFYGIKTEAHPEGFLFNFCPFCGGKIDAPFAEQDGGEA